MQTYWFSSNNKYSWDEYMSFQFWHSYISYRLTKSGCYTNFNFWDSLIFSYSDFTVGYVWQLKKLKGGNPFRSSKKQSLYFLSYWKIPGYSHALFRISEIQHNIGSYLLPFVFGQYYCSKTYIFLKTTIDRKVLSNGR